MDTDVSFQTAVKNSFGPAILDPNGVIDREKLGQAIFADPEKRKILNKLSHPRIFRKIISAVIRLKLM